MRYICVFVVCMRKKERKRACWRSKEAMMCLVNWSKQNFSLCNQKKKKKEVPPLFSLVTLKRDFEGVGRGIWWWLGRKYKIRKRKFFLDAYRDNYVMAKKLGIQIIIKSWPLPYDDTYFVPFLDDFWTFFFWYDFLDLNLWLVWG